MEEVSPFYKVKCLLAGETNVGKSSILQLLTDNKLEQTSPTIGMAYKIVKYELEEYPLKEKKLPDFYNKVKNELGLKGNNQIITCNFWDCAGQIRFRSITTAYFRDVDIAFLIFDMSNRESFEALDSWRLEILKHSSPNFVLIGCKSDLRWTVTSKEIQMKADSWNAKSYILSCVQNNSIGMVRRAIYISVSDLHRKNLDMQNKGMELPPSVKEDAYKPRISDYVQFDTEPTKTGFCCYN